MMLFGVQSHSVGKSPVNFPDGRYWMHLLCGAIYIRPVCGRDCVRRQSIMSRGITPKDIFKMLWIDVISVLGDRIHWGGLSLRNTTVPWSFIRHASFPVAKIKSMRSRAHESKYRHGG